MLTLTRKEGESFVITVKGVRFEIIIREVKENKAMVSFDAPKEVKILRKELEQCEMGKSEQ